MSGHSDFGIFYNFGASSVLPGYKQILHPLLVLRNQARDDIHHVERENSSVESILSFGGVCRVYNELQELKEEDKGREEVQEIERESQVEEKRSRGHDYGDDMKGLKHLEPRCVCR